MREGLTGKTGQAVLAQMYFKYILYHYICNLQLHSKGRL